MAETQSWSTSVGRWMGVPVRVHFLFFLFIAVIFAVQSNYTRPQMTGTAVATVLCLVVCVLLHELAHIFALTNLGGSVRGIVFGPWGGISEFTLPPSTRAKAIVYLAGPFFSGCLFALGAFLLTQTGTARVEDLILPYRPTPFNLNSWEVSVLKIGTWINFQLMILNLIPCYPFDGAGALRAIVGKISDDDKAAKRRESTLQAIGIACGFALIACGWMLAEYDRGPIRPTWFLFVAGGITLIFAARFDFMQRLEQLEDGWVDEDDAHYDEIYGDATFFDFPEEERGENYSQWLVEKQEERERTEHEREIREAEIADDILKKLHKEGINSLSDEEKNILQRVSARIRSRRQVDF